MCRSVARVPFFGGGGRFGRSWGMRQSRPGCCRAICCGARRAWLAVAPSNAMRAACDELAVPLLIVAMKTYRKHVLGRAMVPRLWRMGGAKGCTQNGLLLKLFHARALQGSSGRLQESLLWFFLDRAQARFRAGMWNASQAIRGPRPLRAAACFAASSKPSRQVVVSPANRSLRCLQRKGVEHSFWA